MIVLVNYTQADLELAVRHVTDCERRVEEQRKRIARLKAEGQPTALAQDLLGALLKSRELLKAHLATMTMTEKRSSPAAMRKLARR
jgi:hypothetical protein